MRRAYLAGLIMAGVLAVSGAHAQDENYSSGCGYDDCTGRDAGEQWAREKGITDPGDCPTEHTAFYEGCQDGVRANQPAEQPPAPVPDDGGNGGGSDDDSSAGDDN